MSPQSPQMQFDGIPALPGIERWRNGDVQETSIGEGLYLFGHVEGDDSMVVPFCAIRHLTC